MSSVFDQRIEAVRDTIPESVLDSPWKRTLLLVVFLVVGIAAILFFAIFGLLKGIFGEDEKSSDLSILAEDAHDEFGYKPGDIYYSKPGTGTNPILADLWEKSDETWYK